MDAQRHIDQRRRTFLQSAAIGLFAFSVSGCDAMMSPMEARERGADFSRLLASSVAILDALGDALVPGAKAAGLAHYIDANLARDAGESLLIVRYLDVTAQQTQFYTAGLAALDSHCRTKTGKPFTDQSEAEVTPIIASLLKGNPPGWDSVAGAPPAPLFYLAVRGDAVDIVYGTMAGFEALDIPYAGHINPKSAY